MDRCKLTTTIWSKAEASYPTWLAKQLKDESPSCINILSSKNYSPSKLSTCMALFCSVKAPAGIMLAVHDLAQQWRHGSQVIISGFHSPVEQEALEILLRGPGQVVIVPARSLPKRIKPVWRAALDAGRLTLLSPFPERVRRSTKETAIFRNRVIAALADEILIAYAHPGSSTAKLALGALGWGKPVYTLPHESNAHLQDKGVLLLDEK